MTNEEFQALVSRLETEAKLHPGRYKAKVILLALAGYGYVGFILAFLIPLFVLTLASISVLKLLAIKLIIPVAILIWVVLRAMWVRIDPPQGRPVIFAEAPELYAMIDSLRQRLQAPPFHRVLLTDDFNAAVMQVPQLGLLGWYSNYLLIGLPLMKALTPAQFEAVLAHEFGHLAGGHGRLSNWIYRLRMGWMRLLDELNARRSWGTFAFRPFFKWYAPYFHAYSFPLARANEYEADGAAARLVSPRAAAEALTAVHVVGAYLNESYWPGISRHADEVPHPAFAPYSAMDVGLATRLSEAPTAQWLERAMGMATTAADTHPSLADRLNAIGETPGINPPREGEAADQLLGVARTQIAAEFDRHWQERIAASWEQRHREVQQGRERLAQLDALEAGQELDVDAAYERAMLTESFGAGPDAALEQLRTLVQHAPDKVFIAFALGQRLLLRDREEGIALVQPAMERDGQAKYIGLELLRDYYWRIGKEAEAHAEHARLVEQHDLLEAARAERDATELKPYDHFLEHDLDAQALARLQEQLRAIDGVRSAWLVRKHIKLLPEKPLYVLGFATTATWSNRKARVAEIQKEISTRVAFPGETLILCVEGRNQAFAYELRVVPGACVL